MSSIVLDVSLASRRRRLANWIRPIALLAVAYGVLPLVGSSYLFEAILTPFLALSLAAVGLNLLTGYAGQLSLGTAAFMAVGAFAAYNFNLRVHGLPLIVSIGLAGISASAIGIAFGLPSLRLRGFYLAVSTLAAQFFVQWALTKFGWFSNDNPVGRHRCAGLDDRRRFIRWTGGTLSLCFDDCRRTDGAGCPARQHA